MRSSAPALPLALLGAMSLGCPPSDNSGAAPAACAAPPSGASATSASSATATAPAAQELTADERDSAWRYAVALLVYQGILEQAEAASEKVLETCGAKVGVAAPKADKIKACAPEYVRVLTELREGLPYLQPADSCPAQHRADAHRLLGYVIGTARFAPRIPRHGMGTKTLIKREGESGPRDCPELRFFRCTTSSGVEPCQWYDLDHLWRAKAMGFGYSVQAVHLLDGTPVTRQVVERRAANYVVDDPPPPAP